MNVYNPLTSMKRLEGAGLPRQHAEAIASEIGGLRTKELDASLDRQTIKLGGFVAALIALATTILGVLISIK